MPKYTKGGRITNQTIRSFNQEYKIWLSESFNRFNDYFLLVQEDRNGLNARVWEEEYRQNKFNEFIFKSMNKERKIMNKKDGVFARKTLS